MFEVHVFTGSAASSAASTGYPPGERHALMIFLRQPGGSDHDWQGAEALVGAESWSDVSLERGGIVGSNSTLGNLAELHEAAMKNGGSFVVYADPL